MYLQASYRRELIAPKMITAEVTYTERRHTDDAPAETSIEASHGDLLLSFMKFS